MEKIRQQTIAEISIIRELIEEKTQPLLTRIETLEKEVVLLGNELKIIKDYSAIAGEALYGTGNNGNDEKTD